MRRELFGRSGLLLIVGFVLGVLPLILDNLNAPPGQDSLSVLRQVSAGEGADTATVDQVHGSVLVGMPLATGICLPTHCTRWQMAWGALYPLLLLAAAILAVIGLRRPPRRRTGLPRRRQHGGRPPAPVRHPARPARRRGADPDRVLPQLARGQRTPGQRPVPVGPAALPAGRALAGLAGRRWAWRGLRAGPAARLPARIGGALATGLLVALTATMVYTTVVEITEVPTIRAEERRSQELATVAREAGIRFAYGDYWTCNRLIFSSREQVICAVLGNSLRPGQERYPAYPRQVNAAERPAFIFNTEEPVDQAFQDYLRERNISARMTEFGKYRIYQPTVTVRPWQEQARNAGSCRPARS